MMRQMFISAALAMGAAACGGGYVAGGAGYPGYAGYEDVVPAGSTLLVRLDAPLSAGRLRPGEPVFGQTVRDVVGYQGEVLVPRGSRVQGVVVDRRGRGMNAAAWVRMESIDMGGLQQRMTGDLVAARLPARARAPGAVYRDGSIRGALPAGSLVEIRLRAPITSFAALRGSYY